MTPKITIPADKQIAILSFIKFGRLSESELALLTHLIQFREGLVVEMNKYEYSQISDGSGLNLAAIATTLHRLGSKGVIKKSGRIVSLHPIYNSLQYPDLILSFKD
jgi:hypothetical protein